MAYGLQLLEGFHETRDRLRERRRQREQQEQQEDRQNQMMKMRQQRHQAQMDAQEAERQLQERQTERAMLGEFTRWAAAGNPEMGIRRANQLGGKQHRLELENFDPDTGDVALRDENGTVANANLEQLQAVLFPSEQPDPVKVGEGDALVDPRSGEEIYSRPDSGGSGQGDPALLRNIDGLVQRGIARDESHAYNLIQSAKYSPQEMVMNHVREQLELQRGQGIMPGSEGYRSREELVREGRDLVREIQSYTGPAEQGQQGGRGQGDSYTPAPGGSNSPSRQMGDQAMLEALTGPRRGTEGLSTVEAANPQQSRGQPQAGRSQPGQGGQRREPARPQQGGGQSGQQRPAVTIQGRQLPLRQPDETDLEFARDLGPPVQDAVKRDPETGRYYASDGEVWYPVEVQ